MTTIPQSRVTPALQRMLDAAMLARIGKLYLATHYCPAPLTAAEVQDHAEKRRELDRLCREIGGGK